MKETSKHDKYQWKENKGGYRMNGEPSSNNGKTIVTKAFGT